MLKKVLRISVFCLILIFGVSLTITGYAKDTKGKNIVFRCGLVNPDSHPLVKAMAKFGEILDKDSKGRLKLDIYSGGQLGDKRTHFQALQTGALDLFMTMPGMLVDYKVDAMKVFLLPYLFDNIQQARAVEKNAIGQKMLAGIQASGCRMVGIGYYQESPRNFFFTQKPVTKLADLKGMKIRAQAGSMYVELMKAFGASATPIAFSELYSALQTGVVDGAENPLSGYYSNKFYEVAKYYLLDGHEMSPNIILFSEMVWKTLTPADQKLIILSFNKSVGYFEKISAANDRRIIKDLKSRKVHILKVADPANWRRVVKPIYKKYGKGQEQLIAEIQNFKK
jgi:tripartite ATP-independent transporter DctP family solute receptor